MVAIYEPWKFCVFTEKKPTLFLHYLKAHMIVGNGLLARAFSNAFREDDSIIVFASGVSNSRESRIEAFARERELLNTALEKRKFLIYFSTCSIHDPDLAGSPYTRHKLEMENLALGMGEVAIFRLPQVVGHTTNPHTLTNYLHHQISTRAQFHVWRHARRNLIDVSDVASIVTHLIRSRQVDRRVTNIACPYTTGIPDLVRIFEEVLGILAMCDTIDAGASYEIDTSLTLAIAEQLNLTFDQHYIKKIVKKYYA